MLDQNAVTRLVEQQINKLVTEQVMAVFTSDAWLQPLEQKVIQYAQDRILGKFSNSAAVPEIIEAVKKSVTELFNEGRIPGVEMYVKNMDFAPLIEQAVAHAVGHTVKHLSKNPEWADGIQKQVTSAMVQRTVAGLTAIDVTSVIRSRTDEVLGQLQEQVRGNLSRQGIQDVASQCELTVMDGHVVVENNFTAKEIQAVEGLRVKDLAVTGSVNIENPSWQILSDDVAQKTLDKLTDAWKETLTDQVRDKIVRQGVGFENVRVNGDLLVENKQLSGTIINSSLQTVGTLHDLKVKGEARFNQNTFNILNKRVGVNTQEPEMALSVWDEEVAVAVGKHKANTAFVGTTRKQALSIGVNRESAIEIDESGLTAIKQLRVGLHKISHSNDLPGWSGTKGDVVFNANPVHNSNVFAWQCLGGHKWKVIRSIE